jgi:hypothetical protein
MSEMSESSPPSRAAVEAAERILTEIYGEDLINCHVSLETVAGLVQEGMDSSVVDYKGLVEALIGAMRKIDLMVTPPEAGHVQTKDDLMALLGERADSIRQITSRVLAEWEKLGPNR